MFTNICAGVGIPYSLAKSLSKALKKKYYKAYKKEFTKEDLSKNEETSELEINTDYIDSNWCEIGICKYCRYVVVDYVDSNFGNGDCRDYIDSNWREIGICKGCRYAIVDYEPDSNSDDY